MKFATLLIVFALAGIGRAQPRQTLTVCMDAYGNTILARHVASSLYAGIGVHLDWRLDLRGCPDTAVRIQLAATAPEAMAQGVLAHARPYGDGSIVVFYDRVARYCPEDKWLFPTLLGHVLAHEIGHVLEGIDRHSETGVMKANWKARDLTDMTTTGLQFEEIDADLIHAGIDARRGMTATR